MGQDNDTNIKAAVSQIAPAQEVLIVTHNKPTYDSIGASLALMLALQSLGKKVTLACSEPMTVAFSNFVGVNKIVSRVGRRNFVVSLDYVEGSIEKVSYNIEGAKFNLVIEPRAGFPPFSEQNVGYSYSGVNCDVIVTIDTIHFGGFHDIYEENKELFSQKPVVVVDRHPNNALYGSVNIVDGLVATTVELVAELIVGLGGELTADIASNLLNGLYGGSNNFTADRVNQSTFELAARLIQAGGRRFGEVEVSDELPDIQTTIQTPPENLGTPNTSFLEAKPTVAVAKEEKVHPTPAEWLKPKIFKSSHLL